jgi:hypothetical protein
MANRLRFSQREDWMVFGACLYTFEDAAMAIRGYFATLKNDHDKDFEYLRLFGFLNACYLQFGALERLCAIIGIENKKAIISKVREHDLIQCRHMLASHTTAYDAGNSTQSITIEQVSLGGISATFIVNETLERKHVDFSKLYDSWATTTRILLYSIIRKFVMVIYKSSREKQAEYLGRLEETLRCIH